MKWNEATPPPTAYLSGTVSAQAAPKPPITGPLDTSLPWVIELRVVGTPQTVQMQIRESMLLGRDDPEHDFHPEIDLTPFDGFMQGVSRKHAVITAREGRVSIKDLNSTNGTRLNGFQLVPGMDYQLVHGDELMLGELRFQVQFAVMPSATESPDAAKAAEPSSADGRGRRILVVEDDADVSTVFKMGLEKVGYQVAVTSNATAALDVITNGAPDLIVVDLLLPDLSGLDLLQYVRKHEQNGRHIPVIVVSASTGGFQSGKALEAGADLFLGKPLMIEDLVKAVADALTV